MEACELLLHRFRKLAKFGLEAGAINRIANQWRAERGEVHAHLMGSSGLEPAFEQRGDGLAPASEGREQRLVVNRLASALAHGDNRHLGAARPVPADRRVDDALTARRRAPDKGEITALERAFATMVGELSGENAMGLVGLGHNEETARVLVEAMHNAWPRHAADARQARSAMGDKRVHERAVGIAGAGMHDETRGLVDDDDRLVLVDDVERNFLRFRLGARRCRHADLEAVARFDRIFHVLYGRAAEHYVTLPDQSLQAGAAQAGQTIVQETVETKPCVALVSFRRQTLGRNR